MPTQTQNSSGYKTFTATGTAIEAYVRVAVDSNGEISAAGASDRGIGVTQEAIAADGNGTVKLWSAPGTFLMQAAAAITRGASIYAAASGEVDDTGTYDLGLVALEAATAQGDIIEFTIAKGDVLSPGPYDSGDVGTLAAAGSVQGDAAAIVKKVTFVTASDGTKGVVLPAASAGLVYEVYNTVAANLKIYPASGDDINDGTTNAAISIDDKTFARFVAVDSTTWAAIYTVAT